MATPRIRRGFKALSLVNFETTDLVVALSDGGEAQEPPSTGGELDLDLASAADR